MAESTLSISYDDLQIEIGRFLGYDVDPDNWTEEMVDEVDRYIQAGVRQFYYPPAVEGSVEAGYEWSFLKPTITLETESTYETGDIVVASGTCTLTDGIWPTWAATHGTLVIDGTEYSITTRDGNTQLTVVGDDVTADEGDWYLAHAGYQDLPDDFGRIVGDLHFEADVYSAAITVVSEHRIQTLLESDDSEGRPIHAAVRFKASDGSTGQRQEIVFWPKPDDDYTLTYRYEAFAGKLVTSTNAYPLGGMKHSELLTESCLAIAEQRANDERGIHWESFMRLLASAIQQDRKNGARYYGAMSLGEASESSLSRSRVSSDITYKGSTW